MSNHLEKIGRKRRSYDSEFKERALEIVKSGRNVRSVAESLGIKEGLLYKWRRKSEKSDGIKRERGGEENISRSCSKEIASLKTRIAELEKEVSTLSEDRAILKKALHIFSQVT